MLIIITLRLTTCCLRFRNDPELRFLFRYIRGASRTPGVHAVPERHRKPEHVLCRTPGSGQRQENEK